MLLNLRTYRLAASEVLVVERIQTVLLDRVGDGDDLRVGLLEQRAHVRAALAAGTDQRDVHLVTGSDIPRTTQDVRSDNRGCYGRGRHLQELPARCVHVVRLVRNSGWPAKASCEVIRGQVQNGQSAGST